MKKTTQKWCLRILVWLVAVLVLIALVLFYGDWVTRSGLWLS